VDFNGGMPRVPGVPPSFLKEGKIPRVLYARPVEDRAKLNEAYAALDKTTGDVMAYISVLIEKELPKPDFLSAEKDDLTTWFYPFPMMTNDFVPSVSVSDSILMVGSSKNFAEGFYATWKKESPQPTPTTGVVMDIHFDPMWNCAEQWIDLAEKEAKLSNEEPQGEEDLEKPLSEPTDFAKARKILKRMRKMEHLHYHRNIEDDKMRSSFQLKVAE